MKSDIEIAMEAELEPIQKVAEKYGGAMTITSQDGWFKVKVLLGA